MGYKGFTSSMELLLNFCQKSGGWTCRGLFLSSGEGNGTPLQYSCLENPMDGEPGGLQSMGSRRVGHHWSNLAAAAVLLSSLILFYKLMLHSSTNVTQSQSYYIFVYVYIDVVKNSGSWWWIGRPGVLRFMGSQRVRHDWANDLIWSDLI